MYSTNGIGGGFRSGRFCSHDEWGSTCTNRGPNIVIAKHNRVVVAQRSELVLVAELEVSHTVPPRPASLWSSSASLGSSAAAGAAETNSDRLNSRK